MLAAIENCLKLAKKERGFSFSSKTDKLKGSSSKKASDTQKSGSEDGVIPKENKSTAALKSLLEKGKAPSPASSPAPAPAPAPAPQYSVFTSQSSGVSKSQKLMAC